MQELIEGDSVEQMVHESFDVSEFDQDQNESYGVSFRLTDDMMSPASPETQAIQYVGGGKRVFVTSVDPSQGLQYDVDQREAKCMTRPVALRYRALLQRMLNETQYHNVDLRVESVRRSDSPIVLE